MYGQVNNEVRRENIESSHSNFKETFSGRTQLTICEKVNGESHDLNAGVIQVNMFGAELNSMQIKMGDMLLI